MANILVVDDELGIRDLLSEILNDEGHQVELAENAAQARAARGRSRPDLVLLDIWMPDTDGVTLLKEWSSSGLLSMPVIMMSGHATIDTAVEATKIGAIAFLEKPITLQKLLKAVEQGLLKSAGRKPLVTPAALLHAVDMTVEVAMTGQVMPVTVDLGPGTGASVGDEVVFYPSGKSSSVRAIEEFPSTLRTRIFVRCMKSFGFSKIRNRGAVSVMKTIRQFFFKNFLSLVNLGNCFQSFQTSINI